jgi:DNA-binding response OmpR family regulator
MASLLLVDDDAALRAMVEDYFSAGPHRLRSAPDAPTMDRLLTEAPADLVILDRGLPGEDGISIAHRLRAGSPVGIVMLTGKAEIEARVEGLDTGADDYVTKPFSLAELAARVDAVLRRRAADRMLPLGPLVIDLKEWRVATATGTPLDFSPTEVDLVVAFASNPDRPLTRDELLRLAPARDDPNDRSIDSRVARLRQKLADLALEGDPIRTLRGYGYVYTTRG